jgi:heme-degrading monooxygenase HmoA
MVLYVSRWDIRPEQAEAYQEWAPTAVQRLLAVPGVRELRGYRPATGSSQVVITMEFDDMAAWAAWYGDEDIQRVHQESRLYEDNVTLELWGPSPIVPEPIRPGS